MRRSVALVVVALGGCAAPDLPPAETPYYRGELAASRAAPAARRDDAAAPALREAVERMAARGGAEMRRIAARDETEGLLDLESPESREFLAKLADPAHAEAAFTASPLDLEHVLVAVYARNPGVAAARAEWAAAAKSWDQAASLSERLARYRAFAPARTDMQQPGFPRPGAVTARADMAAAEVEMARERARMRLLEALVGAANAYHVVTHHTEELRNREEQLALADRAVESMRRSVESGMDPQSDLLMAESERAMADDDRAHAVSSLSTAHAELNAWLGRDAAAPLWLHAHEHRRPPAATPELAPLLDTARRFSPAVRMARADAARADAAVRMQETMLLASPDPGMPGDAPDFSAATLEAMRARRTAALRAAEEAALAAERAVVAAHYELDVMRRMYELAARSETPLAAGTADEQRRLFESGRIPLEGLIAADRARLRAAHDAISARHDYLAAEAMLWESVGARPELVPQERKDAP